MAYKYRIFYFNNLLKKEFKVLFCRQLCLRRPLCANHKRTMQLLPEVEELLQSGSVKHRLHPGIQKKSPTLIPEILRNAVDKILSNHNEKVLLEDAKALNSLLQLRRIPAEVDEINQKIRSVMSSFDSDCDDFHKTLCKHEFKMLRKKINSEIGRWKPIEYNEHECLVYLVGRLAANYASTSYVFQQLQKSCPTFKPTSYFDFGCGVGSALWAAHSHWADSIKEYFCVDTSAKMNDLCLNILTDETTEHKHIEPVYFRQFLPASSSVQYDLVISAFSLMDLPTFSNRLKVVDTLWRKTKEYLIFIEYGSTAGFHCVAEARDFILHVENSSSPEFSCYDSGAYVVSPCPHDSTCPKILEKKNSSCGFIVPYQVLFPHRLRNTADRDWISYVILKKGQRPSNYISHPRIVKPVLKKSKHVYCRLCCPDGMLHEIIVTKSKHGRHAYRCARESRQGDTLPVNILTADEKEDT